MTGISQEENTGSKEQLNSSKRTKETADRIHDQIAILENKKSKDQNITVHVLADNKLDVKLGDATINKASRKAKKGKKKVKKDPENNQNIENVKVDIENHTQNTQAYTGKSTTENMRNTKNSAFRMTQKDTTANQTQTSGFPKTSRPGGKSRIKSSELEKRNTAGNGFGIKLKEINIKATYKEDL